MDTHTAITTVSTCTTPTSLNLSLGQKSEGIFVADQTPTPTRLIKNCEEVGLFEDLRHVNPFEETFRRAVEQNAGQTPARQSVISADEDSLHTPQVYPQLETNIEPLDSTTSLRSPAATCTAVSLDVPVVEDLLRTTELHTLTASRQNSLCNALTDCLNYEKSQKYRPIAEKPSTKPPELTAASNLPATIQFMQPQIVTITFPHEQNNNTTKPHNTAIPIQTVKPLILPKPTTSTSTTKQSTTATITATSSPVQHEPSSASLTPTSQLPIKERLKAIQSQKSRELETAARKRKASPCRQVKYDDNSLERRRAASTRYRHKMRDEHKELQQRNATLQAQNEKLLERIRQLEQELLKQQQQLMELGAMAPTMPIKALPAQIQIPATSVHLVMNIPKILVPYAGEPNLQQPITYRVEKK